MDKPVLLTHDGLVKLERELEELRTIRRSEVAERIKYAKDFGDISENAEYDEAKNEQGMLEGRILLVENMIRNHVIIEEGSEAGIISVGTTVDVQDDFGKQTFTIVGPAEVDVATGRISMESPVGKSLLGHKVGDTVDVLSPGGTRQIKIVKIN
jgi:transcription elongation factor GreA